ncbi:transposase, partial [Stutzerimonas frequens]|uniref:transposase n=1 Tax=Stutzerimonas frequens TaxID=2968969 RepID=UPI000B18D718
GIGIASKVCFLKVCTFDLIVLYRVKRKVEYAKAQLRAKVEHPFQVIKVRFNHRKVRYRGLEKNTAQLFSLFGLANLVLANPNRLN